jgi:hypothetical protein
MRLAALRVSRLHDTMRGVVRATGVILVAILAGCTSASPATTLSTGGSAMATDLRLHEAATAGDVGEIERLLAAGSPIDAQDADGRTPVMAATLAHRTDAVRALVRRACSTSSGSRTRPAPTPP